VCSSDLHDATRSLIIASVESEFSNFSVEKFTIRSLSSCRDLFDTLKNRVVTSDVISARIC